MDPRTEELVNHLHEHPLDPDALRRVREHLAGLRQYSQLATILEWWSKKAPTDRAAAQALLDAAEATEKSGRDLRRVGKLYERALVRDPTHDGAARRVDAFLRSQGQYAELGALLAQQAEALEARGRTGAEVAHVWAALGNLVVDELHDLDRGIDALTRAAAAHAADVGVALRLGGLLAHRATHRTGHAADADREAAAACYAAAARRVEPAQATRHLEHALDLAPGNAQALAQLEKLVPAQDAARLVPRWQSFIDHAPDGPNTDRRRALLAKVLFAGGRLAEAATYLRPLADKGNEKAQKALAQLERKLSLRPAAAAAAAPRPKSEPAETPTAPPPGADGSRLALLRKLQGGEADDGDDGAEDESPTSPRLIGVGEAAPAFRPPRPARRTPVMAPAPVEPDDADEVPTNTDSIPEEVWRLARGEAADARGAAPIAPPTPSPTLGRSAAAVSPAISATDDADLDAFLATLPAAEEPAMSGSVRAVLDALDGAPPAAAAVSGDTLSTEEDAFPDRGARVVEIARSERAGAAPVARLGMLGRYESPDGPFSVYRRLGSAVIRLRAGAQGWIRHAAETRAPLPPPPAEVPLRFGDQVEIHADGRVHRIRYTRTGRSSPALLIALAVLAILGVVAFVLAR